MRSFQRRLVLIVVVTAALAAVPSLPTRAQEIPASLTPYTLPNEHVYTLQPALRYQGHIYQIHYFTPGDFNRTDANVIGMATPDTLANSKIAGLLITADSQVVEDDATIRKVFSLYRTAFELHKRTTSDPLGYTDFYPFDEFRKDLKRVTANPFFISQIVTSLLKTDIEKNADAFRAMLTAQRSSPDDIQAFTKEVQQRIEQNKSLIDSIDQTLETPV